MRTLFGDAAAATLLRAVPGEIAPIGPFIYGTDGAGAANLIVAAGGMRRARSTQTATTTRDENNNIRCDENLFMDGRKILDFSLSAVPQALKQLLQRSNIDMDDVDLFVFHQANNYMLTQLRKLIGIPQSKFYVNMAECGNTVSSTIPIALKHAMQEGRSRSGSLVALVGFGVGYSWGSTLVRWA